MTLSPRKSLWKVSYDVEDWNTGVKVQESVVIGAESADSALSIVQSRSLLHPRFVSITNIVVEQTPRGVVGKAKTPILPLYDRSTAKPKTRPITEGVVLINVPVLSVRSCTYKEARDAIST